MAYIENVHSIVLRRMITIFADGQSFEIRSGACG